MVLYKLIIFVLIAGAGDKVGEVVSGRARVEWVVAVRRKKLMENPHYETGSQDAVVILASDSKVTLFY